MGLLRYVLSRMRGDRKRVGAIWLTICFAVTSFCVLAGSAATQHLEVTQSVEENFRTNYDILVRPKGSIAQLEAEQGLIRGNAQSSVYGGISFTDWEKITHINGVEVAAPIAMMGQVMHSVAVVINLAEAFPENQERALVHITGHVVSRNGHLNLPWSGVWVYLTRAQLQEDHIAISSGGELSGPIRENIAGKSYYPGIAGKSKEVPKQNNSLKDSWSDREDIDVIDQGSSKNRGYNFTLVLNLPISVAAIDPASEQRLLNMESTVTSGRWLTAADQWQISEVEGTKRASIPTVLNKEVSSDFRGEVQVDSFTATAAEEFARFSLDSNSSNSNFLKGLTPTSSKKCCISDAVTMWSEAIDKTTKKSDSSKEIIVNTGFVRPDSVQIKRNSDAMIPEPVEPDLTKDYTEVGFAPVPTFADTGYRKLDFLPAINSISQNQSNDVALEPVGVFDGSKIMQGPALAQVPMELYSSVPVLPADAATKEIVGERMLSDLNPAGYLQPAAAALIPISQLGVLQDRVAGIDQIAPISVMRVRVADVTGNNEISRERIRSVAEQIALETGLDVDIVVGSSSSKQLVKLPASKLGLPSLRLHEMWTKKGVSVVVTQAVDRKSLLLFGLIFLSSALTVAMGAHASVRARRQELGVLACIGWRPELLRNSILLEMAIIGVSAATVGAIIAWPLAALVGARIVWWQSMLAIPAAVLMTVLAGSFASRKARKITPITAVRSAIAVRNSGVIRLRGAISLGMMIAAKKPIRTGVGAIALGIGIGSLTLLISLNQIFHGRVVGTVLGDAVSVQVRGADTVAGIFLLTLGLISLAMILFLTMTEDARVFASLNAAGWTDRRLGGVVVTQSVCIGLLGAALGVVLGLGTIKILTKQLTVAMVHIAAEFSVIALVCCIVIALIFASRLRKLPLARLLAQD
ncbi:MAG: FtsX-like permease family protein [Propionibacteriaceae bacterium]